jgi:hypothetical protein
MSDGEGETRAAESRRTMGGTWPAGEWVHASMAVPRPAPPPPPPPPPTGRQLAPPKAPTSPREVGQGAPRAPGTAGSAKPEERRKYAASIRSKNSR